MQLDERMLRLIAVGASITANCLPCLEVNVKKALENGADEREIAEAIQVGKMVRKGAASKMDELTERFNSPTASSAFATAPACCASDTSHQNISV